MVVFGHVAERVLGVDEVLLAQLLHGARGGAVRNLGRQGPGVGGDRDLLRQADRQGDVRAHHFAGARHDDARALLDPRSQDAFELVRARRGHALDAEDAVGSADGAQVDGVGRVAQADFDPADGLVGRAQDAAGDDGERRFLRGDARHEEQRQDGQRKDGRAGETARSDTEH